MGCWKSNVIEGGHGRFSHSKSILQDIAICQDSLSYECWICINTSSWTSIHVEPSWKISIKSASIFFSASLSELYDCLEPGKKKKTLITPALVGEAWWESEISVRMVRKQLNNYNATPEHPYSCSQGGIQSKQETRIVCVRVSVSACLCWKVSHCLHLENVYDINVRKQPLVHCSQIHIDRNKSRNKQEQEDRTAVIKKSLLIVLFLLFSFEKQANITALLLIMKT